jgi:hypothetical protein
MTAHVCDDTPYPAAAMPDECTCTIRAAIDNAGRNGGLALLEDAPMTANPDEYNGWANRETWAAVTWLTNTPELYDATLAVVRLARRDGLDHAAAYGPTPNEYTGASTFADMMAGESLELIAELLRNDPRNGNPEMMLRDIGSAWRIDWREIYAGLLEHLGDMAATAAEDES